MADFTGGATLPPVENLEVSSTTFTSITITWKCNSCKLNATGYIGKYTTITSNPNVTVDFNTTYNVFSAHGLIPRTKYEFQVAAYHLVDGNTPPDLITGPSVIITAATAVPPGREGPVALSHTMDHTQCWLYSRTWFLPGWCSIH